LSSSSVSLPARMDNLREGSKLPSLLTSFLTYQKNRELQFIL
jgi:hypothetical protein